MDWKKIILMAKGKVDSPETESTEEQLKWRARVLLENTVKPAVREVLEFLLDIGNDDCYVDIFIGLTKETIIGMLTEFRYVHIDRTNFMELPLNETKITAEEVKRLLAEDVRIYFEKLAELAALNV